MKRFILLFLFSYLHASSPNTIKDAKEFVLDSYKIKQGKSTFEIGMPTNPFSSELLEEYPDGIENNDILKIHFFQAPRNDISEHTLKVEDGYLQLPYLSPIKVLAMTVEELQSILIDLYKERSVSVSVKYFQRPKKHIELKGTLTLSEIPVDGKLRLLDALKQAGLSKEANLTKSIVIREGVRLPIDLHKLIYLNDMSQNIVMRPKDKIFIADPIDNSVLVITERGSSKSIPLSSKTITLKEALIQAGCSFSKNDQSPLRVLRENLLFPKSYHLSWGHVKHLTEESLLLLPGDRVVISESPFVSWNHFFERKYR